MKTKHIHLRLNEKEFSKLKRARELLDLPTWESFFIEIVGDLEDLI